MKRKHSLYYTCPAHGQTMRATETQYGRRHACLVEGCTVVCWDGQTSTPADQGTRTLRHQCHQAFDPLWKQKTRWQNRREAYRWLQETLELTPKYAHIGMLDARQCRYLLEQLQAVEPPEASMTEVRTASGFLRYDLEAINEFRRDRGLATLAALTLGEQ